LHPDGNIRRLTGTPARIGGMALIKRFEERPLEPKRVHGPVVCGYRAVQIGTEQILQMETYGSENRVSGEKVSQSIQVDEAGARELMKILQRSFPQI
jgi:hypothetical protein